MKIRVGLAMFAGGVVLLIIFFFSYNPNRLLRKASQTKKPTTAQSPPKGDLDPAEVDSFLTTYNPRYAELKSTWLSLQYQALSGTGDVDEHQVEAAHIALLSFAGSRNNVDTILRLYPLLTLPQSLDHQLGQARRLAALWPATLPPGFEDLQIAAQSNPDALPALFAFRNRAAAILGYSSYLHVLTDDLDLEPTAMAGYLAKILAADRPLYKQLHNYLTRTLAANHQVGPPTLLPSDWLGTLGPGSVNLLLDDPKRPLCLPPVTPENSAWNQALELRQNLDLPDLPLTLVNLQPVMLAADTSNQPARWFPLPQPPYFGVVLNLPQTPELTLKTFGMLGLADIKLACLQASFPPLLQEPSCRALALAIEHLYTLAGRSTLQAEARRDIPQQPQLTECLLGEALGGPIWKIPLAAGAYWKWLQDINRGMLPSPIVTTRFWQYAAAEAQLAPSPAMTNQLALPAAAFGTGTQPAAPLDDVLGWVMAHQIHRYICRHLLNQNIHSADYRHQPKVGDFLLAILRQGQGQNWESLLRTATGEDLDPTAMMEYYQPLTDWLQTQ